jgi:hypothetical protein
MNFNDINPESIYGGMRQPEGYTACDEIEFPRRINTEKIDNIVFDQIDTKDYPDFADAYIFSADMNGIEMTIEELDDLNYHYPDFVHEKVIEHIF